MTISSPSTMRRDVVSAYVATAAKVLGWAAVSAITYRWLGAPFFAVLALIRGVLGLLNYTSLGLGPAMISMLARVDHAQISDSPSIESTLRYADPLPNLPLDARARSIYATGVITATTIAIAAGLLVLVYSEFFEFIHDVPLDLKGHTSFTVLLMGAGVAIRLASDAAGSVLQVRGRMALDNLLQAGCDLGWAMVSTSALWTALRLNLWIVQPLDVIAGAYLVCALALYLIRGFFAGQELGGVFRPRHFAYSLVRKDIARPLLWMGMLISIAQLADFLYAPTDFILINELLNPLDVATYAPAVQIDSALLLLVSAVAAVILPKAAVAHAAGEAERVRRYYVSASMASIAILLAAGIVVLLTSRWIFTLWLGNPMAATQAILPLVLIHTVIGGSSAVGRSILLGMGKVKPFAAAALISGICNVILSITFVKAGFGLYGIVYGTIIAVVGRCAIWMPWYVLRTIRRGDVASSD